MNAILKVMAMIAIAFATGCVSSIDGSARPDDPTLKPKIAIMSNNPLADAIGTELFARGFTIIERLRLGSVLSEKSLQLSGVTESDNEKFIQAGKILNVDSLMSVGVERGETGDIHMAVIKVVNVNTGQLVGSFNYKNGRGPLKDSFHGAAKKIADTIASYYIRRDL